MDIVRQGKLSKGAKLKTAEPEARREGFERRREGVWFSLAKVEKNS